jgi:hypothetical protein
VLDVIGDLRERRDRRRPVGGGENERFHLSGCLLPARRIRRHPTRIPSPAGRRLEVIGNGGDMSTHLARVMVGLAALSGVACSLPTLLRKNLHAIEASTDTITKNSDVVKHSTSVSEEGIKSFESLRGPMESMAKLEPTLKSVAALDGPMSRVAGLAPSMREVASLQQPMTRLVGLQPSLDATAALGPSMDRVAAMRPSLDAVAALGDPMKNVAGLQPGLEAVAGLKAPMDELAALKGPLERVADLREPMTRLAALAVLLDRPILLAFLAVLGLAVWGGVTFLAVRLALLSAGRVLTRS